MGYLGTPPQSGFITTAKQRVTSSTNNYVDLDHAISSLSDVIVWVNFIKQDSTNLTLTTSTRITLGATLVSADIVEIAYLGKAVSTQTPSASSVTDAMITGLSSSKLSGVVPTANLGSGTASSSTVLYGDQTFKAEPSGNYVYLNKATDTGTANDITFDNFSSTYNIYKIFGHWHNSSSNTTARFRLRNSSGDITSSIYRAAVSRVLLTSSEGNINGSASEYDVAQFRLGNGGSTFDDHRQSVEITVFRPNEPDSCMVHFKNSFWSSDNNEFVRWEGAGWCNTQEAHTGIKFYQSSGTINDYYYVIYGLKDS